MANAERVQSQQMFGRLGHPALVCGDHEQHRGHRPDAGEHVADEALVAGHVDEGDLAPPKSVHTKPRSMVSPRRRSSSQRSGSIPVNARSSADLPWST